VHVTWIISVVSIQIFLKTCSGASFLSFKISGLFFASQQIRGNLLSPIRQNAVAFLGCPDKHG
jgi:hypothetical protein